MNILFCTVGRRGYIVDYFRKHLPFGSKLIGTSDRNDRDTEFTSGFLHCDKSYMVPSIKDERKYIDEILHICKTEKIDMLLSFYDYDTYILSKYLKEFEKAINNDLDMPGAVSVLWKILRDKKAQGKIDTIKQMDFVLGLDLLKQEKEKIPNKIKQFADERQEARKNKNWKKADELRNKINKTGWKIEDVGDSYRLEKF